MLIDDEAMQWMSPEAREKCMDELRRAFPGVVFRSLIEEKARWEADEKARRDERKARRARVRSPL